MKNNKENYLTKKEIIKLYNISDATLNNWIKLGLKINNNKININDIENFIKDNKKLSKRANKTKNNKKIIPSEFFKHVDKEKLLKVIEKINNIEKNYKLEDLVETIISKRIEQILNKNFVNNEYKKFLNEINNKLNKLNIDIELEDNNLITGILYQYLMGIKKQSKYGAYYTPEKIIKELVPSKFKIETTFLDPACGSGFILFEIFKKYKEIHSKINPLKYILGNDIDKYSTLISKIELVEMTKNEIEFVEPNIYNIDGLELDNIAENIDYVITNPPYGAKIKNKELQNLTCSKESFIYFLYKSINNYTNKNGKINMVLPVSLLTTLSYKDNRLYLVENGLYKIKFLGKIFKGVMSDIILLYIDKNLKNNNYIEYIKDEQVFNIDKNIFKNNPYHIINEYQTKENHQKYLDLLQKPHFYLKPEYFYLGIVTGNNSKKIKDKKDEIHNEEVILGKNFDNEKKFYINPNDKFQQVPKNMEVFKRNKIIYKFISNKIRTKVDFKGKYTTNSVNIYAPENKTKEELIDISKQLNSDTSNFVLKFLFGNVNKILKEYIISIPIFKK